MNFVTEGQKIVIADVLEERQNQINKWGPYQKHDMTTWITILMEEVGEFSQEVLRRKFGNARNLLEMREELIQVAAVAVQMAECLDVDFGLNNASEAAYHTKD